MIPLEIDSPISSLHILSFNVRGIDLRWQEVVLLSTSLKSDVIILLETGHTELSFLVKVFNSYSLFYQAGKNNHSGVLVLVKKVFRLRALNVKYRTSVLLMFMHHSVNLGRGMISPLFFLRNASCLVVSMRILILMVV